MHASDEVGNLREVKCKEENEKLIFFFFLKIKVTMRTPSCYQR